MTALSITAANVAWVSGPVKDGAVAGEAFVAGDVVYLADNGTWKKAQCDGTAVEAGANGLGMALATADAAGAKVSVALPDAIVTIGTGFTVGVAYFIGATAGDLVPEGDLGSTNKVTIAGLTVSATAIQLCRVYNAGAGLA